MSALTLTSPAPLGQETGHPRRNMIWVTWRHHRVAILAMLALLAGIVTLIVITGIRNYSAYDQLVAHLAAGLENAFSSRTDGLSVLVIGLHLVPILVGAFVGAPLIAREYETRTYEFAWTQGAGRNRAVVTKLALLGAALAAGGCIIGIAAGWWFEPFNAIGLESPWLAGQFDLTPLMVATWMLFAFAAGACAGTLLRRTVPAMATTTGFVAVLELVCYWKLDYLLRVVSPLTRVVTPGSGLWQGAISTYAGRGSAGPAGSWLLQGWFATSGGHRLSPEAAKLVSYRLDDFKGYAGAWLREHHLVYVVSYQPGGRFWLFQGIEAAVLVGSAALFGWMTLRLARLRS